MAKSGRPPGSFITPEKRLEKEIMAWLLVNQRIRQLVEKQLKKFEEYVEGGQAKTLEMQIDIMSSLRDLLTSSSRVVENGLKSLAQDKAPGSKPVTDDPDEVMRQLGGGGTT